MATITSERADNGGDKDLGINDDWIADNFAFQTRSSHGVWQSSFSNYFEMSAFLFKSKTRSVPINTSINSLIGKDCELQDSAPWQTYQDSLPEYDVLDAVLRLHIDCGLGLEELQEAASSSSELHEKIVRMVDIAQFKRDQASVIFKTSPRTFGRGRRMPIVMKRAWSTSREMT